MDIARPGCAKRFCIQVHKIGDSPFFLYCSVGPPDERNKAMPDNSVSTSYYYTSRATITTNCLDTKRGLL